MPAASAPAATYACAGASSTDLSSSNSSAAARARPVAREQRRGEPGVEVGQPAPAGQRPHVVGERLGTVLLGPTATGPAVQQRPVGGEELPVARIDALEVPPLRDPVRQVAVAEVVGVEDVDVALEPVARERLQHVVRRVSRSDPYARGDCAEAQRGEPGPQRVPLVPLRLRHGEHREHPVGRRRLLTPEDPPVTLGEHPFGVRRQGVARDVAPPLAQQHPTLLEPRHRRAHRLRVDPHPAHQADQPTDADPASRLAHVEPEDGDDQGARGQRLAGLVVHGHGHGHGMYRQQREAEVAEPGQETVQRGLVRDRAPDQGGAGGVGADGHRVEPARPPLVQPPADAGSRTRRHRCRASPCPQARSADGEWSSHQVVSGGGDLQTPGRSSSPSWRAVLTAARRLLTPSLV